MILIIGAGLSGLLTGYRLKKEGIPFKILEARSRIGGRINTLNGTNNIPIEMGATWFTNQHRHLIGLLEELGIEYFEQYMDPTVFYQPSASSATQLVQIPNQSPSFRISGGTSSLINTLFDKLDKKDVFLNQPVTGIKFKENSVKVIANETYEGTKVIIAVPPKLWAKKILFEPKLPDNLMHIASQTHTWMEDAIKIALTYNQPFWEQENIARTLFSNAGPITELYDHCNHEKNKYALCGFINSSFKNRTYTERRESVLNQLKNVFGVKALEFIDYEECVWSQEEHTFEASDPYLFPHQNNGNILFSQTIFNDRLLISGSESTSEFAGYMDGAVHSANTTVKKITNQA